MLKLVKFYHECDVSCLNYKKKKIIITDVERIRNVLYTSNMNELKITCFIGVYIPKKHNNFIEKRAYANPQHKIIKPVLNRVILNQK